MSRSLTLLAASCLQTEVELLGFFRLAYLNVVNRKGLEFKGEANFPPRSTSTAPLELTSERLSRVMIWI